MPKIYSDMLYLLKCPIWVDGSRSASYFFDSRIQGSIGAFVLNLAFTT